jgi:hypothetical protein
MLVHDETGANARLFCEHGPIEALLSVAGIFTLGAQFAPTSSYLLRTDCLTELRELLLRHKPTFGDFFLECIASRGQLAYLPKAMSVYRRDHVGSYSARERQFDGPGLLARFRRNADATLALERFPWVGDGDVQSRLGVLRLDYLRKLVRLGAFAEINSLVEDGPVTVETPRDWVHLHVSRRLPRLARIALRTWRLLGTTKATALLSTSR